jgi:hypothetical protein
VKLEAWAVGFTAGSREVQEEKACDKRHPYRIIIIIIILIIIIISTGIIPKSLSHSLKTT